MRAPPGLRALPGFLRRAVAVHGDTPALRFHAWHLGDLEREAFQMRIVRLRDEREPVLADFDGDAVASARGYATRPLAPAVTAFSTARAATLTMFAQIAPRDGLRSGTQVGVGFTMLAHMPERILAHDRSHALELADLVRGDLADALRQWAGGIATGAPTPCNQPRAVSRDRRIAPRPALHHVQRAIVDALADGAVTTRHLSDALAVSARTLQRRLARRGLTVACLVDETRRALAIDRLCVGMALPQIAAELGYADARARPRVQTLDGAATHRCPHPPLRPRCLAVLGDGHRAALTLTD